MSRASVDLRDHYVQFRVCDIYLPDPGSVLSELHSKDLLCGRVIDMSDGGSQQDAFVVVEVDGIERPMVVPTGRVMVTNGSADSQ